MKPTSFPSQTTPWRVQLPSRFFPDGKRKTRYFATKELAEDFCRSVKRFGLAAIDKPASTEEFKEYAPLIAMAAAKGYTPTRLFEAMDYFERFRLNVTAATVREAIEQFSKNRKTKVGKRTWSDDNFRLLKFLRIFEKRQISEITETDLRKFFDGLPGHTRSIYKTLSVLFGWAKKYHLISVNPMAEIEPTEKWNERKEIYSVETFERMLRISAGLEPARAGELPTREFAALFPWFVLSGFCGLRSCEAFRSFHRSDSIRWTDLYLDRGFIEIRSGVGKHTRAGANSRHIETAHYVEAAAAWLGIAPKFAGETIVPFGERKIQQLRRQFEQRTGIQLVDNGLRNSFASYALTFNGLAGVGKLALEMGNSEAICKRFYVRTLEPGTGAAWFNLRPAKGNVVPMAAVAA